MRCQAISRSTKERCTGVKSTKAVERGPGDYVFLCTAHRKLFYALAPLQLVTNGLEPRSTDDQAKYLDHLSDQLAYCKRSYETLAAELPEEADVHRDEVVRMFDALSTRLRVVTRLVRAHATGRAQ